MCIVITAKALILLFTDSRGLRTIYEAEHAVASKENPLS